MALTPSFFLSSCFSVGQTSPHCGPSVSVALLSLQAVSVHSTGSSNKERGGGTEGRKGRQGRVPPFLLCSSIEQHKRKHNSTKEEVLPRLLSPLVFPVRLQTHTNTEDDNFSQRHPRALLNDTLNVCMRVLLCLLTH